MKWTTAAVAVALGLSAGLVRAAANEPSQRLAALERDPKVVEVAKEPLSRCRVALERAQAARAAGDATQALSLEALATDELEVAQAVVRAVALETSLASLEKRAVELDQDVRQTETLIESTIAMRERRRRLLDELRVLRESAASRAATPKPKGATGAKAPAKATSSVPSTGKATPTAKLGSAPSQPKEKPAAPSPATAPRQPGTK